MPKGRGSNHRRRNRRQKMAVVTNKIARLDLDPTHPLAKAAERVERTRRMHLMIDRNPKNFTMASAKGSHWSMGKMRKRSDKYWKKWEKAHPSRRNRGVKSDTTKGS